MTDVTGELKQRHPDLLTLPSAGDFTILLLFSFFVVFGLVPAALPHLIVRAMSYQDTASVYRAIYIGPIIMAIFTLGCVNPTTNKSFEFAAILREGALLETSFRALDCLGQTRSPFHRVA
jgi:hypothetical protein